MTEPMTPEALECRMLRAALETAREDHRDFGVFEVEGHRCIVLRKGHFILAMVGHSLSAGDVVGASSFGSDEQVAGKALASVAAVLLRHALDPQGSKGAGRAPLGTTLSHLMDDWMHEATERPSDEELDAWVPGWRAIGEFCGRLDPEVLGVGIPGATDLDGYRWLAATDALRGARLDLFRRYGFAGADMLRARDVVDRALTEGRQGSDVVVEALAASSPDFAARAATRGSRKRVVAAVERLAATEGPIFEAIAAFRAFAGSGLPWDREPATPEDCLGFTRLASVARDLLGQDAGVARRVLDVPGGRYGAAWDRFRGTSLGRTLQGAVRADLPEDWDDCNVDVNLPQEAAREINHIPMRLAEYLLGPLCEMSGISVEPRAFVDAAVALCFRDLSLMGLAQAWEDWHRIQPALGSALASCAEKADVEWLAPTRTNPLRRGDLELLWLRTPLDLLEEGSSLPDGRGVPGMDHCVATYIGDAADGLCHILSVRRRLPGGLYERLSTAEFRWHDDDEAFGVVQNMGRGNVAPSEEAARAVRELQAGMNSGKVAVSPHVREAVEDDPYADGRPSLGNYVSDPDDIEALLRAFEPLLAADMRGLSPEAFLAAALPDLSPGLSP